MTISRRGVLQGATALGAAGAAFWGFAETGKNFYQGVLGAAKAKGIAGGALPPEYKVDPASGEVILNQDQRVGYTMCMGCTSVCGIRVRVDKASGDILRATGNPYSPLSTNPHIPYDTPIKDAITGLSAYGEQGLAGRSTACGRGNAAIAKQNSKERILKPMKRVGERGSGQWKEISWDQLIEETVEGGDLFGEGHVEGLRAIRDLKTPLDPENPEYGPKANQLVVIPVFKNGRLMMAARFAKMAYGTRNFVGHRSYCGLSMRAGYAAMLDNLKKQPHLKPDYRHAKYMLFIGTAPGNAGNPYKLQGTLMGAARGRDGVKYAVVDPVLTNSQNHAFGKDNTWVPIRPGTDGALVMGMIRWIMENERYDAKFLAQPSGAAAKAAGEASWSNATHLVIDDPEHPKGGSFLRQGMVTADLDEDAQKAPMCLDAETGELSPAKGRPATLFHQGTVRLLDGSTVPVATSLSLLRREALRKTLAEYSADCGVPEERIISLARDFTSVGKQAAADCHGGTMHTAGFYTAYAIVMLNALVGNLNAKGGTTAGGGRFKDVQKGPRYNLLAFPGKVKVKGVDAGRGGFAYEKTSEFKRLVADGKNPYPAQAPWHSFTQPMGAQWLTSVLEGYPYKAKAVITWSSNPVYGVAGMENDIKEKIKDTKRLPLFIAIDPFINETSRFADYIVPDRVFYEAWGWASAWGGVPTKVSTARWPVVDCQTGTTPDGRHMDMDNFFIDVAKRMGLPGFGDKAIPDADGNLHPLHRSEDFWLRAGANVAFDGGAVPQSDDADMAITGVDRIRADLESILKPDEWRRVAYVYNRGGRYEDAAKTYKGESFARTYKKGIQVWNETVGMARNSMTGKKFVGCPTWQAPSFADGTKVDKAFPPDLWPFRVVSTKSQLRSSSTGGNPYLDDLKLSNAIAINTVDAEQLSIKNGDWINVISPSNRISGQALVRQGIARGAIGIEHGYGHRELGVRTHKIGNVILEGHSNRGLGTNSNDLGYTDPTSQRPVLLADPVVGSIARQALPARIEKMS
ncbi:molybdopterin-dependent oxidoreductase [Pseudovibrio denitrificans]|uniref:molybdopterin-dependent oxidoreductase n=1 Tax=Pseudovibrio denitrificans TaxID=258256 RepID=UPI0039BED9D0